MGKDLIVRLLPMLLGQLLKLLTPDIMRYLVDKVLDSIEEAIKKSETKIDDTFLPLISLMREAFNIPDNNLK
ncbi:MAG TPA: hypothetical protein ENI76_10850 [Ignavibacteria bacterium]|nr:hypothetical protein [Ignavibacteria bacterium]